MSALLKKLRKLNEPDQWLRLRAVAKQHRILSVAVAVFVMLAAYWLFIASDRYVSQAHIVVQRTDLSGGKRSISAACSAAVRVLTAAISSCCEIICYLWGC